MLPWHVWRISQFWKSQKNCAGLQRIPHIQLEGAFRGNRENFKKLRYRSVHRGRREKDWVQNNHHEGGWNLKDKPTGKPASIDSTAFSKLIASFLRKSIPIDQRVHFYPSCQSYYLWAWLIQIGKAQETWWPKGRYCWGLRVRQEYILEESGLIFMAKSQVKSEGQLENRISASVLSKQASFRHILQSIFDRKQWSEVLPGWIHWHHRFIQICPFWTQSNK